MPKQEIVKQLKEHLNQKEIDILEKIVRRKELEDYFFKTKSDIKWFKPLKILGYFEAKNAPPPIPAKEEGFYTIPIWNVLNYLEKVSRQVNLPGNEAYIDDLLGIIKDVSNYRDSNGEHIDNFHTWRYFVRILFNIPNDKIPHKIIDLISIWIDSKFDTLLFGTEILRLLLPKFVKDEATKEDIEKAEIITDLVTGYKWKQAGFSFSGREEEEAVMKINLQNLNRYLLHEDTPRKIGARCSDKFIFKMADKLKDVLARKNPRNYRESEFEDKIYRITVSHKEYFKFDCSLGIIRKEQIKSEKPGDEIIKSLSVEPEKISDFRIDGCDSFDCFSKEMKIGISKADIPGEVKNKLYDGISGLYGEIFEDHSYIWYKEKISPFMEEYSHDARIFFAVLLKEIVYAKVGKDKSSFEEIYRQFMGEKYRYPFFRRLILFIIGQFFDDFREKFWEVVDLKIGENIFDTLNYKPELYSLLTTNCAEFSETEKARLKEIIGKGPQTYLPATNKSRYIHHWKQTWYSALQEDPEFKILYEKEITQTEERISDFEEITGSGHGPSPLTKEEIHKMPNKDLVEYCKPFRTEDFIKGPTVEGLLQTLTHAAKEKPEKFVNDLDPFLDIGFDYVYHLLRGIEEAWQDKKEFDWLKLFSFIKRYIDRDEFWNDELKLDYVHRPADHELIVGVISKVIRAGTEKDDWAFAEKHLGEAKEIIFFILDRLTVEADKEEVNNPVSHLFNTWLGKVIIALIELLLRTASLEDSKKEARKTRWAEDLRNRYEKLLRDQVYDAYTAFGRYFQDLFNSNESWTEQKIKEFNEIKDESLWSAFMIGYLKYNNVYNNVYKRMKTHYLKSISYSFKDDDIEQRVSYHIARAYLKGLEDFSEDDLLGKVFIENMHSKIIEMIQFFWMVRDQVLSGDLETERAEQFRANIIAFWKKMFGKYKDKDETTLIEEEEKILSTLSLLTVFLKKIDDENFEWLMLSAPYVHLDFSYHFFIEYLDKLKDKGDKVENARYLGEIFLKMLEHFTPDFDPKHIRTIIEFIYTAEDKGAAETANNICNEYGKRGNDLLKDLYKKYKDQTKKIG